MKYTILLNSEEIEYIEYIDNEKPEGQKIYRLYNFANIEDGSENSWPIEFNEDITDLYGLYDNKAIEIIYKKIIWDGNTSQFIIDPIFEEIISVANGTNEATEFIMTKKPLGIPEEILTGANDNAFHITKFMINDDPNVDISDVFTGDKFDYETRQSIEVIPFYSNEIDEQIKKKLTIKRLPSSDFDGTIGDMTFEYPINTNVYLSAIKNDYLNLRYRNIESDSNGKTKGFYRQANYDTLSMVEEIKMNTDKTLYVKTFSELRIIFYLWSNAYSTTLQRFERKKFYREDLESIIVDDAFVINPNDYLIPGLTPKTSDATKFFAGWNRLQDKEIVELTYNVPLNQALLEPNYTLGVLEFQMYPVFLKKQGFEINWRLMYTKNNITKPTEAVFFDGPDPYPVEDQFTTKTFTTQLINAILNADNPEPRDKRLISGYKIEGYKISGQPWRDGTSEFPISIDLEGALNYTIKRIGLDISLIRNPNFILIQVYGNSNFINPNHLKYRKFFAPNNITWNDLISGNFFPETTNSNYKFRVSGNWDYSQAPHQMIGDDIDVEVYNDIPPVDIAPIVGYIGCYITSGQK